MNLEVRWQCWEWYQKDAFWPSSVKSKKCGYWFAFVKWIGREVRRAGKQTDSTGKHEQGPKQQRGYCQCSRRRAGAKDCGRESECRSEAAKETATSSDDHQETKEFSILEGEIYSWNIGTVKLVDDYMILFTESAPRRMLLAEYNPANPRGSPRIQHKIRFKATSWVVLFSGN